MKIGFKHIPGFLFRALIILSLLLISFIHPGYGQATKDPTGEDSTTVTKEDSLSIDRSVELEHLQALVDSSQIQLDLSNLPKGSLQKIQNPNFRDIDIQDLLRGL